MPEPRRTAPLRRSAAKAESGSARMPAQPSGGPAAAIAGDTDWLPPLPAEDPEIFGLSLEGLAARWVRTMEAAPIGAESMRGADRRAQALGVWGFG